MSDAADAKIPLSSGTLGLLKAIQGWIETLPPGSVAVEFEPLPKTDYYDLETVLALRPANPAACPVRLLVTSNAGSPIVGFELDQWAHLADMARLRVKPKHEILLGIYVDSVSLPVQKALLICRQVAAGKVHLEVGVWRGRLVSTWGYVPLPCCPFKMRGPSEHWFWRLAAKLGLAEIREVSYAPWS